MGSINFPTEFEKFYETPYIMQKHWNEIPHRFGLFGVNGEVCQTYFVYRMLAMAGDTIVNTKRSSEDFSAKAFTGLNAVLDVFDEEPLPKDSKLIGLPNVMLMPHRGGPTTDRWRIVTLALIDDILRIFDGKEPALAIEKKYAMAMSR